MGSMMKDVLWFPGTCFVLHGANEKYLFHPGTSLSFISPVKNISLVTGPCFVLHNLIEGHFLVSQPVFCLS